MVEILNILENAGTDPYGDIEEVVKLLKVYIDGMAVKTDKVIDSIPIPLRRIAHSLYDSKVYRPGDVAPIFSMQPDSLSLTGFKFPGDVSEKYSIKMSDVFEPALVEIIEKL